MRCNVNDKNAYNLKFAGDQVMIAQDRENLEYRLESYKRITKTGE